MIQHLDRYTNVWVVIPMFNEARVVGDVVREVSTIFPNVVCVDDASTDDSAQVASLGGALVLRHVVNLGQGAALQTGIEYAVMAGAEIVVTFDADGQHRVEDAESLVHAVEAGADVALGSRFLDKQTRVSRVKRITLKLATVLGNLTTGIKLTDAHNGLRAFTREVAQTMNLQQNRMAHASEIISLVASKKWTYREVPVLIEYTEYSKSKGQSVWNSINILRDLLLR